MLHLNDHSITNHCYAAPLILHSIDDEEAIETNPNSTEESPWLSCVTCVSSDAFLVRD
jgi:hypothetical protein